MMKHRTITTLAIAAVATTAIGFTAFAAAEKQAAYTVTIKNAEDGREIPMSELKTDENGVQFYETEDGVMISIVNSDSADSQVKKLPQKKDEKGNTYIEMEDGSRVYVTQSNSASVD